MIKYCQRVFSVSLFGLLIACGGGSGGSSGGTPVVPPPPPPPPPPQNTTFPASFSNSTPENSGGDYIRQTFKYNAPSDTPPTSLALTGPDADFFEVLIEATTADGNGDRDLTVIVRRSGAAMVLFKENFENPQDANKDNIYEFSFSGTYQGRNIVSDVTVSITDILDRAEAAGRFYVDAPGEERYGSIFASIPDITGDGKAELSLLSSNPNPTDTDIGYIIASESIEGEAGIIPMADTTNHIAIFLAQQGLSGRRGSGLSAKENTDGSVDILVAQAQLNRATIFHIPQSLRNGSFGKEMRLGTASASSYVLDFTNIGRDNHARLIDDVNGDGKADIFLQAARLATQGIIFGSDSSLNSDVTASFDIELLQPRDFGTSNLEPLSFKKLPDLNGDGIDDFMIVRVKRVTFLSGATLQDATLNSLDFENLTASQGFSIPDIDVFFRLGDVIATTDFDGDGFPSLVFITKDAGGGGVSLPVIDGDDFMALADTPTNDNFTSSLRSIGPNVGDYQDAMLLIGDRTGDGIDDLLAFKGSFGGDMELISGTVIRAALNSTAPSNQVFGVPSGDVLDIDIERFNENATTVTSQPLWFPQSGLFALGSICGNTLANQPCAGVGLFQATEIEAALINSEQGLLLRSPDGLPF